MEHRKGNIMSKTHKPKKAKPHTRPNRASSSKYMWVVGIVSTIAVLFVLVLLLQLRSTVPLDFEPQVLGAPSLQVISDEVIDHGDLPVNQFVETEFVVQNVGDEILHILDTPQIEVVEGCCPSQVTVDDRSLSPGEITTIRTRFTMHPGMDGPHDFRVHVRTTDPEQPDKELTILSNWIS
jgi:uncharacterized integral membrane protein